MDGIILDVDGTLWDSRAVVAKAWSQALKETVGLEREFSAEVLTPLFGKPMDEIMEALLPEMEKERRDTVSVDFFSYENRLLETEPGRLFPGVYETMEQLSKLTSLYIVSNCQSGYIEVMLMGTGMTSFVKDFQCYGDNGKSKAENIRILMERNDIKEVVYVGDTQGDAQACKEAGIPFVFAEYGFGDLEEEPAYRIQNFSGLLHLVNDMKK